LSRSASRSRASGSGNCRLEQVNSLLLLPSCNDAATSGADFLIQSSQAPCTSSPEKGMIVPRSSGRNLRWIAYSLAGAAEEKGISIVLRLPSSMTFLTGVLLSVESTPDHFRQINEHCVLAGSSSPRANEQYAHGRRRHNQTHNSFQYRKHW
jgi:hypothetical protein